MLPEPGARIRLVAMPDDLCPIEPGAEGTVDRIGHTFPDGSTQIVVTWDNGRTLMLVHPIDTFEVIR